MSCRYTSPVVIPQCSDKDSQTTSSTQASAQDGYTTLTEPSMVMTIRRGTRTGFPPTFSMKPTRTGISTRRFSNTVPGEANIPEFMDWALEWKHLGTEALIALYLLKTKQHAYNLRDSVMIESSYTPRRIPSTLQHASREPSGKLQIRHKRTHGRTTQYRNVKEGISTLGISVLKEWQLRNYEIWDRQDHNLLCYGKHRVTQ